MKGQCGCPILRALRGDLVQFIPMHPSVTFAPYPGDLLVLLPFCRILSWWLTHPPMLFLVSPPNDWPRGSRKIFTTSPYWRWKLAAATRSRTSLRHASLAFWLKVGDVLTA